MVRCWCGVLDEHPYVPDVVYVDDHLYHIVVTKVFRCFTYVCWGSLRIWGLAFWMACGALFVVHCHCVVWKYLIHQCLYAWFLRLWLESRAGYYIDRCDSALYICTHPYVHPSRRPSNQRGLYMSIMISIIANASGNCVLASHRCYVHRGDGMPARTIHPMDDRSRISLLHSPSVYNMKYNACINLQMAIELHCVYASFYGRAHALYYDYKTSSSLYVCAVWAPHDSDVSGMKNASLSFNLRGGSMLTYCMLKASFRMRIHNRVWLGCWYVSFQSC